METSQAIEYELTPVHRQSARAEGRIVLERQGARIQRDPSAVGIGRS